ncbi:MAG: hypothetical protein AAFU61_07315, partial [Pseudomonadota bacterium]
RRLAPVRLILAQRLHGLGSSVNAVCKPSSDLVHSVFRARLTLIRRLLLKSTEFQLRIALDFVHPDSGTGGCGL